MSTSKPEDELEKFTTRTFRHDSLNGGTVQIPKPLPPSIQKVFMKGKAFHISELDEYLRAIPGYQGSFFLQDLKNVHAPTEPGIWGIVILLPPPTPSGKDIGHFVAMVFDTKDYWEVDFFDSFGRTPTELGVEKEIESFVDNWILKRRPPVLLKWKINTLKKQDYDEKRCGAYVVQFLIDRLMNKKTFKQATGFSKQKVLTTEKDINKFTEL